MIYCIHLDAIGFCEVIFDFVVEEVLHHRLNKTVAYVCIAS